MIAVTSTNVENNLAPAKVYLPRDNSPPSLIYQEYIFANVTLVDFHSL